MKSSIKRAQPAGLDNVNRGDLLEFNEEGVELVVMVTGVTDITRQFDAVVLHWNGADSEHGLFPELTDQGDMLVGELLDAKAWIRFTGALILGES